MRHHHFGCRHERRRHRAALGIAGVASIAAAILASGCHDGRRGERERGEEGRTQARVERALDWLELEGEARERARAAGLRLAGEVDGLRRDGTQLAATLLAQWRSDVPDAAALHGAVDREIDGLRARAHRALDDVLELHAILDDEQRAEVGDLLASREDRRHRHRW
jgi:hypothetical protein